MDARSSCLGSIRRRNTAASIPGDMTAHMVGFTGWTTKGLEASSWPSRGVLKGGRGATA